jgi:ubiquinone/menaquinone biosynthesis C-methylase UbiE
MKRTMLSRAVTCTLCGDSRGQFLFERRDHEVIRSGRAYAYYGCPRCGVRFQPKLEVSADPYFEEKLSTEPDAPDAARRYVHWDRDIARSLWRLVPGGRLLDFGSGWGDMLTAAREIGYQAEGLDISAELAAAAMERSMCPVFVGTIHEAKYGDATFDVINSHFALEYVPDLVDTMREMARVLTPGGVLRVCAYTWDSLPARLRGPRWWNYAPSRGFIFSEQTFRFLAAQSRLELTHVIEGGEQSPASYLAERTEPTPLASAVDLARYYLARRLSLTSCRAFYLRKTGPN